MDRVELAPRTPESTRQERRHRHRVGDGEGQVEVRPAIAVAVRERRPTAAGGDHARISRRHLEHAVAHAVSVVDAEHAGILRFRLPVRD